MAAGLVCISSGDGGASEGLLALYHNPEQWEKLVQGGQQRALDLFDVELSVDQLARELD